MNALHAPLAPDMWKLRFLASWRELADDVPHAPMTGQQIESLHLRFGASSPDTAASRLYFEAKQWRRRADDLQ